METTVVIPTFNRCALLRETIESVKMQSQPVQNIIVVDDGSTDDTQNLLAQIDKHVTVLHQTNLGKSTALNNALSLIPNGWVWIIDDDDIVPPDAHKTLLDLTKQGSNLPFVYGRHTRFRKDGHSTTYLGTGYWSDCNNLQFLWETANDLFVHQGAMLVHRDAFDDVGGFDESLVRSQDYDMLLKLASLGAPKSTQEIVLHQRVHDGLRGRIGDQFSVKECNARWVKSDQNIFRGIYETWPLNRFYLSSSGKFCEPQALIRRGIVMARKGLWQLAISDFHQAIDLDLNQSESLTLSSDFSDTIRGSFGSKYGIKALIDSSECQLEIYNLAKKSKLGRKLVRDLAIGLRWRIKESLTQGRLVKATKIALLSAKWWLASIGFTLKQRHVR